MKFFTREKQIIYGEFEIPAMHVVDVVSAVAFAANGLKALWPAVVYLT